MTNHETTEQKAANHKGWGRLWSIMTQNTHPQAIARALECAKAANDTEAVTHLEAISNK